jgi:transcription initiation factor TFIID subunit 2
MAHKLDAGMYKDRFAFKDDFKLMISNCYIFNGTESLPGKLAYTFDQYFDKQWERANATLEQLRLRAGFAGPSSEGNFQAAGETNKENGPQPGATPFAPEASAPEVFVAPQPPIPQPPQNAAPRPLLKLKLSSSTSHAPPSQLPPTPLPPPVQTPSSEPTKPTDTRQPSVGPSTAPLDASATNNLPRKNSQPPHSRSSSPAVPLAVAAPASVNIKPKFKFTTKPKVEPVDDEFLRPMPPSRPSPRESPAPVAPVPVQAEAAPSKPKKIRLSIGLGARSGGAGSHSQSPVPSATTPPPTSATGNGVDRSRNGFTPTQPASNAAPEQASFPINVKKMTALIKKIIGMDESYFFRRPVDPIADGCPT